MSRVSANRRLRSRCRSRPSELDDGLLAASEVAQFLQIPLCYRSVRRPAACLLLPCVNLHRRSPAGLFDTCWYAPGLCRSGIAHGRGPASGGTVHSRSLIKAEQATSRRDRPSCPTVVFGLRRGYCISAAEAMPMAFTNSKKQVRTVNVILASKARRCAWGLFSTPRPGRKSSASHATRVIQ
jgi:hypothetical protein